MVMVRKRDTHHSHHSSMRRGSVDMVLVPMDSRRFALQEYMRRKQSRLIADTLMYENFCVGIDSMLRYTQLSYAVRPTPAVGRVDLAAAFLLRGKWMEANILLGGFDLQYCCI